MSDLNSDRKTSELIEILILATEGGRELTVDVKDGGLIVKLDNVKYDFDIDFDPETHYWFLEE